MASVLYVVNNTTQTVAANGTIALGTTVHRNCQSQARVNGNAINIVGAGYFTIDVSATFTAATTGDVTIQLYQDGVAVQGATATGTVATASTQIISVSFTSEILKQCNCNQPLSLTLVNTGAEATYSNIAIRVKRDA